MSGELLEFLRDEAATLLESALPASEELRPVVGALISRLERLEQHVIGELKPAPSKPAPEAPAEPPAPAPSSPPAGAADPPAPDAGAGPDEVPPPVELKQAQDELQAAQRRVDELTARQQGVQ